MSILVILGPIADADSVEVDHGITPLIDEIRSIGRAGGSEPMIHQLAGGVVTMEAVGIGAAERGELRQLARRLETGIDLLEREPEGEDARLTRWRPGWSAPRSVIVGAAGQPQLTTKRFARICRLADSPTQARRMLEEYFSPVAPIGALDV